MIISLRNQTGSLGKNKGRVNKHISMKAFWACTITNKLKGLIRTIKALLFRLCPPFKTICCPTAAYLALNPTMFHHNSHCLSLLLELFYFYYVSTSIPLEIQRQSRRQRVFLVTFVGVWLQGGGGISGQKPSRQPKWQQSKERITKLRWCWLCRLKKNNNQLNHKAQSRGGNGRSGCCWGGPKQLSTLLGFVYASSLNATFRQTEPSVRNHLFIPLQTPKRPVKYVWRCYR